MCIFCAETVKTCAAASEYISYFLRNVWLLLETFQCILMNVRLLLKRYQCTTPFERKCEADIFLCVAPSENISMFFNESAVASGKILTTASERKYVQLLLKLGSHRAILFWRKKLKVSPLLFPDNSDIFKAIFLYHPTNFYRQLIPTKLILSPSLEEKVIS